MTATVTRIATGLLLATLAGPAAAGTFKVPQGCTAYATVQMRSCQVSQHYRCDADAEGDQWTVQMDGNGPYYASKIDAETRWMESYDLTSGEADQLGEENDPASFSTLLEKGRDDFDFFTQSNFGELRRYVGFDRLTGTSRSIDGITLEETEFELTAYDPDGQVVWMRRGNQFIHRGWRIFLPGTERFENAFGDKVDTQDTPVEFALPGDKGFLETEPKYDCDTLTASYEGPRP